MKQKKRLRRKVISYVLALVMVISTMTGIMPGMSLTAYAAGVSYVDGSGTTQTVDATELAASTTSWTSGSWYIVPEGGLTISGRIAVGGTVNLILRDGASLTASAGIRTTGATLNIYAQSAGTGALTATGGNGAASRYGGSAGIGGNGVDGYQSGGAGGTINIYGGTITATGGNGSDDTGGGAGIGGGGLGWKSTGGDGGTVNIYGGTVTATGGNPGSNGSAGAGIGGGGKGYNTSTPANGTLTLGKGVKLYNGTDNTGTVLDDSDSAERSYSGSRPKNMFAEGPDFVSHTHSFTYTADGATITATCTADDCTLPEVDGKHIATLTIAAPALTTFGGTESAEATITDENSIKGDAKVQYQTKSGDTYGTATETAPTGAGNHKASITLGEGDGAKTASVEYTIAKAAEDAPDANTDQLNIDYSAETISAKDGYEVAADNSGTVISSFSAILDNATPTVYIRKTASDGNHDPSAWVAVTLTARPAAPTGLTAEPPSGTANGKIKGTTTSMEYKLKNSTGAWTAASATETSVAAGTYLVRTKATNTTPAGKTTEVAVITALQNVINMIDALPDADKVTANDKAAIEAARAAYNALGENDQADVTNYANLVAKETALAIAELPEAANVTTAEKEKIEAARNAYKALTDDQKTAVGTNALAKLEAAESAIKVLGVDDKLNALPAITKENKEENRAAVEAAKAAYNALTDDEKGKVDKTALAKLEAAESSMKVLDMDDKLNALPGESDVKLDDKATIEAAREAYKALSDTEKEKVDKTAFAKLEAAEKALATAEKKEADDTAAAKKVADAITKLPASGKVATTDKAAIETARKAYDALTADQKAKVPADTLKKLTDSETALAAAGKKEADNTAAVKAVSDKISALPASGSVTATNKDAIEAARKAYDALTADQKAQVPADTLKKLTEAEKALSAAEKSAADAAALAASKKEAYAAMSDSIKVTQKGKKLQVTWGKCTAADGYDVYVGYCGKGNKKSVTNISKNTTTKVSISKVNGKKLNLKKNMNVCVQAYKMVDGKKVVLAKSMIAHVVGNKNAKYTNVKSLKLKKTKYTVSVGKTAKVKATVKLVDKNKKHIPKGHGAKLRYRSLDESIATVDKKGNIKGVAKGETTVVVYSINGIAKKAKVTVK